ncbi:MAG: hypothetical protein ACM3MJ_07070 [Deltaproteobacteria bacterium]
MTYLLDLWRREPARIIAFAQMLLVVLVTVFGIQLTGEQQAAIVGLVAAFLALLGGEITRSRVSPAP